MAPRAALVPSTLVWVSAVVSLVIILPVSLDTKVMVTVILGLLLRLLQSFMGPIRRYSEEFVTQYAAMAAYYLRGVLAFYTANAIWSSSSANLYWVMWSIYLLMFTSTGPIDMRRYTLSAGGEQRWRLLQLWLYLSCLQWGLIWTDRTLIVLAVICFSSSTLQLLLFLLIKPRVVVLDYNSNAIADYMRWESASLFEVDANTGLPGGGYPVVRAYSGRIITVSDVVECLRRSCSCVQADDMVQCRDICLSYSFCQLLARRYYGFHCAEEGAERVRVFAFTELLPDDDPRSYKRAFSIIEKQLAFLHDYFFTNYHQKLLQFSPLQWSNNPRTERMRPVPISLPVALFVLVAPLAVVFWLVVLFVIGRPFGVSKFAFHTVGSLLFASFMFLGVKSPMPMYWCEIWTAFQNNSRASTSIPVHATSWERHLIKLVLNLERYVRWCRSPRLSSSSQPYWQGQIGQYSLIQDYDNRSLLKAGIGWFNEQILGEESHGFIRHRPVEEYPVSLSDTVKKRVARTLRDILVRGPPTRAKTCLQRHKDIGGNDFGWTLKQETHTHTILIWHIATCYCEMFSAPMETTGADAGEDRQVAVDLSRHCAYLVAFLPQLLPDHSLHTKLVLQQVLQEAKESLALAVPVASQDEEVGQTSSSVPLLGDRQQRTRLGQVFHKTKQLLGLTRMSMEEKRETIRRLVQQSRLPADVNDRTTTTFQQGIKLGQALVDATARNVDSWKLLADFWAETILYVAPSDNAAAHIELLAKGGQFLTHLWALLSNAGIFKRATEEI